MGSCTCWFTFADGLFDRASQIAAAHAVLDGHIARVGLAIDFRSSVLHFDLAELRQSHALAGRRQEADILDGFLGIAVGCEIAHHQVVALFALQNLADGAAADGGLNGVLDIGDIDLKASRLLAVHHQVQIGLAEDTKESQVFDALNSAHDIHHLVGLVFEQLQIVAIKFHGQLAFHAAHGLLHVVGDRLREIPDHARQLLEFAIHGADQFLFVLVKNRTPVLLLLQMNEVFGIEKAGGVGAVVGTAHLAGGVQHFGKRCQHHARLIGQPDAFGRPGAGRQRAAHPDIAFIEMRQELGADDAAEGQVARAGQCGDGHAGRYPAELDGQPQRVPVAGGQRASSGGCAIP